MGYLFAILLGAYAILGLAYLWRNDFAVAAQEVLFPAVGAMLFSVYLGIKAIWVDAPPPETFTGAIPLIENEATGEVFGLPLAATKSKFLPSEWRGAPLISAASHDQHVAGFNIRDVDHLPLPLSNLVEFSVLEWLANPEFGVGAVSSSIGPITGLGRSTLFSIPLLPVPAHLNRMAANPYLKAHHASVRLPAGSTVERPNPQISAFRIRTRHSVLTIAVTSASSEPLDRALTPATARLFEVLELPRTPGWHIYIVNVDFALQANGSTRFSRQAQTEARWFQVLKEGFERDFSWSRLQLKASEL